MRATNPQFDICGRTNLWVVKPAALSRGRGIFCENRLDYILAATDNSTSIVDLWVAQKYLERPMLINNTKVLRSVAFKKKKGGNGWKIVAIVLVIGVYLRLLS